MFRHVVVPVDGSEAAERVIDWIAPFRAHDGRLHLVRVVPDANGIRHHDSAMGKRVGP